MLDIKTNARNGKVVAAVCARDGDDVIIVTANGRVKRLSVDEIRVTGRNAQGVTLMKFKKGENDSIVTVKIVPPERELDDSLTMVGVERAAASRESSDLSSATDSETESTDAETDEL